MCARALRRFIKAYSTLPGQPVAVYLRAFAQVTLRGDTAAARAAARALVTQLFTFQAPDDLRIAVCAGEDTAPDWEWVKWLPHCQHPYQADAAGPVRALRPALPEVVAMFGEEFTERPRHEPGAAPNRDEPYVVIVLDGGDIGDETRLINGGYRNALLVDVGGNAPWRHAKSMLRLDFTDDSLDMVQANRSGKEVRTALGRGTA